MLLSSRVLVQGCVALLPNIVAGYQKLHALSITTMTAKTLWHLRARHGCWILITVTSFRPVRTSFVFKGSVIVIQPGRRAMACRGTTGSSLRTRRGKALVLVQATHRFNRLS